LGAIVAVEDGQKVEAGEVTLELNWAATMYAERYDGDFAFMLDMQAAAEKNLAMNKLLSPGQAKGVLNCWRAAYNRGLRSTALAA